MEEEALKGYGSTPFFSRNEKFNPESNSDTKRYLSHR